MHQSDSALRRQLSPFIFAFRVARQDFSAFDLIHAQGDDQLIPRRSAPPVIRTLHGSSLAEAIHNGVYRLSLKRFLLHLNFYGWESWSNNYPVKPSLSDHSGLNSANLTYRL